MLLATGSATIDFALFQPILNSNATHPPNLNKAFVEELKSTGVPFSHDTEDRVFRAHGRSHICPVTHNYKRSLVLSSLM